MRIRDLLLRDSPAREHSRWSGGRPNNWSGARCQRSWMGNCSMTVKFCDSRNHWSGRSLSSRDLASAEINFSAGHSSSGFGRTHWTSDEGSAVMPSARHQLGGRSGGWGLRSGVVEQGSGSKARGRFRHPPLTRRMQAVVFAQAESVHLAACTGHLPPSVRGPIGESYNRQGGCGVMPSGDTSCSRR